MPPSLMWPQKLTLLLKIHLRYALNKGHLSNVTSFLAKRVALLERDYGTCIVIVPANSSYHISSNSQSKDTAFNTEHFCIHNVKYMYIPAHLIPTSSKLKKSLSRFKICFFGSPWPHGSSRTCSLNWKSGLERNVCLIRV